jgi:hypothetical protein
MVQEVTGVVSIIDSTLLQREQSLASRLRILLAPSFVLLSLKLRQKIWNAAPEVEIFDCPIWGHVTFGSLLERGFKFPKRSKR